VPKKVRSAPKRTHYPQFFCRSTQAAMLHPVHAAGPQEARQATQMMLQHSQFPQHASQCGAADSAQSEAHTMQWHAHKHAAAAAAAAAATAIPLVVLQMCSLR